MIAPYFDKCSVVAEFDVRCQMPSHSLTSMSATGTYCHLSLQCDRGSYSLPVDLHRQFALVPSDIVDPLAS